MRIAVFVLAYNRKKQIESAEKMLSEKKAEIKPLAAVDWDYLFVNTSWKTIKEPCKSPVKKEKELHLSLPFPP